MDMQTMAVLITAFIEKPLLQQILSASSSVFNNISLNIQNMDGCFLNVWHKYLM
jgi:hypothetical protein